MLVAGEPKAEPFHHRHVNKRSVPCSPIFRLSALRHGRRYLGAAGKATTSLRMLPKSLPGGTDQIRDLADVHAVWRVFKALFVGFVIGDRDNVQAAAGYS